MLAHRRQRLLAFAVVLLGLLGGWFAQRTRQTVEPPDAYQSGQPDYIVDGLRAIELNISGQPARRLNAKQLRHYPEDDSTELDQPRMILYNDQAPPWRISSDSGWVSAGSERILLSGAVRAQRAATSETDAIAFATSEIELFPDDRLAETDRFVELERGQDRLTAIDGMRFWYSEPMHGKFFGRVRARIATDEK
jgi:lipopolysaccharide export system protein LptC